LTQKLNPKYTLGFLMGVETGRKSGYWENMP